MSLATLASIDPKCDEPGLKTAAEALKVPICFFTAEELSRAPGVGGSSEVVYRHVGVGNVCEAAAIQAAATGILMVLKHKNVKATLAIARRVCTSSASAPEDSILS